MERTNRKFHVFLLVLVVLVAADVRSQPIQNLGADTAVLQGDWLAYSVSANIRVRNLSTGETRNLDIEGAPVELSGDWLVIHRFRDLSENVHVHNLSTGETTNLGLAIGSGFHLFVVGDWLVLPVEESTQDEDLNGDGDMEDSWVLHVHNLSTGETTNLGLAGIADHVVGDRLVLHVDEFAQGEDLNGDGDREDRVLHVHNLSTGETTNLGLSGYGLQFAGDGLSFGVEESQQREDLNGDGDREDRVLHVHSLSTGETTNLALAGSVPYFTASDREDPAGDWLSFEVRESHQGEDLNGDGDTSDNIAHAYSVSTGETTNLGLAGYITGLSDDRLVVTVSEKQQGEDLNGDRDSEDERVLHLHDLSTATTTNLGLAVREDGLRVVGDWLTFGVWESDQGEDLNGDGDVEDTVVHVHNLSTGTTTNLELAGKSSFFSLSGNWLQFGVDERAQGEDLNGDGDIGHGGHWEWVLHVHNLSTGETTNLGLAATFNGFNRYDVPWIAGGWLVFRVEERAQGADLNGDGDTFDDVVHVYNVPTGETTNLGLAPVNFYSLLGDWLLIDVIIDGFPVVHLVDLRRLDELRRGFLRGDCNDDGAVDISDAVSTLGALFLGQGEPGCDDACDSNDDGEVNISDPIGTLRVLFLGQGTIPLPGVTDCGADPTDDDLGCVQYENCP